MARKSLVELGKYIEEELNFIDFYVKSFSNNKSPMIQKIVLEYRISESVLERVLKYIKDGSTKGFYLDDIKNIGLKER